MTLGMASWRVISDKTAAEYCIKYKSIRMAHAMYIHDHPEAINKTTKRPVTYQAVHNAAWRYLIQNPVEGRKMLADGYTERGEILDDETWNILRVVHSRTVFTSKNRQDKFLKQYGLEAYRDVHQDKTAEYKGNDAV